jgi:hypothetical protein
VREGQEGWGLSIGKRRSGASMSHGQKVAAPIHPSTRKGSVHKTSHSAVSDRGMATGMRTVESCKMDISRPKWTSNQEL